MLDFAETEFDIAGIELPRVVTRLGKHLVRHVDTNDAALDTDLLGREKAVEPGAAAVACPHHVLDLSSIHVVSPRPAQFRGRTAARRLGRCRSNSRSGTTAVRSSPRIRRNRSGGGSTGAG